MQQLDKRLMPRILVGETAHGSLALRFRGRRTVIERLRNISESGLSFFINIPIDVSEKIGIAYADGRVKVEVFGRVAWCSQILKTEVQPVVATGRYLVGVELFSPMMLYALMPKR